MPPDAQPALRKTLDCELCIVGAGYAALNGLNAAAKYLRKGDRVVIIDKNSSWGGQWLNQYDFVRLHQPYRMFTAGDQPWKLARHRSHLATRGEVLDHLASVPQISAGHLEIVPLFGHAYRGHRVHDGRVEVDVTPVAIESSDATNVRVRARRLLKATGADIEILEPFRVSSPRVRSVAVAETLHWKSRRRRCVRPHSHAIRWRKRARSSAGARATSPLDERVRLRRQLSLRLSVTRRTRRNPTRHSRSAPRTLGRRRRQPLGPARRRRAPRSTSPGWLVVHQLYCAPESPSTRASAPRQRRRLRPQSVLAFSGTSAYFITHLWYRNQLAEVAPELFRVNFDVEPKLKFMPQREPVRHKAERILRLRFGLAGNYDSVGVRALSARFVHGTSRTMHSAFDRVRNAAASSG
jgi:hypothetical protein